MTAANGRSGPEGEGYRPRSIIPAPPHEIVPEPLPDLEIAHGYLRLTSYVLLQAQQRAFRTLGVLSPQGSEGCTTTAMNLAICMGRTRGVPGRVLLVDGDARARNLTQMLVGRPTRTEPDGPPQPPTLTLTPFHGVDLLTAPEYSAGLAMFGPDAWRQTLGALAPRYPMILVDCPPVLESAEGLVLPACVEQYILVLRAGRTSREMVADTIHAIGKDALGVVLYGGRG